MTAPLSGFGTAICIHSIDQGGASVLPRQGITVIVIHFDEHVYHVAVKPQIGAVYDP